MLGKDIEPVFEKERIGDVKHSLAGIEKAEKLLNYQPSVNFHEGLRKTVKFL
jgi:UDP-glucose 4-epimerase